MATFIYSTYTQKEFLEMVSRIRKRVAFSKIGSFVAAMSDPRMTADLKIQYILPKFFSVHGPRGVLLPEFQHIESLVKLNPSAYVVPEYLKTLDSTTLVYVAGSKTPPKEVSDKFNLVYKKLARSIFNDILFHSTDSTNSSEEEFTLDNVIVLMGEIMPRLVKTRYLASASMKNLQMYFLECSKFDRESRLI